MPKRSGEAIDRFIGARIKLRRSFRGLNLKDLGDALEVSTQQVQKYEAGDNRISAGQLYILARVLGVELAFFFDGWQDYPEDGSRLRGAQESDVPFDAYGRSLNNEVSKIASDDARQALLQIARAFVSAEAESASASRR